MTAPNAGHGDFRLIDVTGQSLIAPMEQSEPVMKWLPIDRLVIDDRYQRPLTRAGWGTIRRIAETFRWSQFSPVLVAPVSGDRWAIIDGQHRTHAAAICGFPTVPCMSVDMEIAAQARAFAGVNGTVTKITVHHVYKAALAANEDWAVKACDAVAAGGCTLMTYNKSSSEKRCGEVFCIGLIRKLVCAGNAPAVTAVLAALRAIDADRRPALYSDYILRPLMTAVATRKLFLTRDLVDLLERHDPFAVLDRLRREQDSVTTAMSREAFVHLLITSG